MKKHLLGLGIFSFIVVSFAVAFAFLYAKPEVCNLEVTKKPVIQTDKRKSCDYTKKRNVDSAFTFSQATLQRNSKEFNAFINEESFQTNSSFKLHFFLDDGKNTKYIGTQDSQVKVINIEGKPKLGVSADLRGMLKTYNHKSNFYVIPELITFNNKFDRNQVEFNANKAISVLWVDSPKFEKKNNNHEDVIILQ